MMSVLLPVLVLVLSSWTSVLSDDTKNISATAGQNVTLECLAQVSKDGVIGMLQWRNPELKSEGYVIFYRDQHFNDVYQDRRFRGRVRLRDPDMRNGDVSVVLRNVTANDSGTYECLVIVEHNGQRRVWRHEPEPITIVKLTVTEPGTTGGDTGGGNSFFIAAVVVIVVFGVVFGVIVTCWILVRRRKNLDQPAGDDDEKETFLKVISHGVLPKEKRGRRDQIL